MEEVRVENANPIKHDDPMFRDWLIGMLRVGPVTVTFEKADGTLREMHCSLESSAIVESVKKTDRTKKPNDEVCSVWDLDKNEWRSFRWDKLRSLVIKI